MVKIKNAGPESIDVAVIKAISVTTLAPGEEKDIAVGTDAYLVIQPTPTP